MLDYEPLWEILSERGIKKTQLRETIGLSTSTLAKLGKNVPVALSVLVRICTLLDCQLSDICHIGSLEEGAESCE